MLKQDRNALLETLDEVVDVYFGPTAWDGRPGGAGCGEFAAYFHLHMSNEASKGMSIGFANEHTRAYWAMIGATQCYCDFDFITGLEIDAGDDWPSRPSSDHYLMAAKHIHSVGIDGYTIKFVNDHQVPYRGIQFSEKKTGNSFTFREDKDIRMFESAREAYRRIRACNSRESTQSELDRFIGSSAPA